MPAIKLHSFKNRDEAHKKLGRVLEEGLHPKSSCREDLNDPEPYQVWSDGPDPHVLPPETAQMSEDDMVDRLLAKLLERMEKKAVK